jgi:hypothetical protein
MEMNREDKKYERKYNESRVEIKGWLSPSFSEEQIEDLYSYLIYKGILNE